MIDNPVETDQVPPDGREPPGQSGQEPYTGSRHFSCSNCGASLLYEPGSEEIKCPYCGTINAIPDDRDDSDYLMEHDFLAALAEEEKRQESAGGDAEAEAVKCTSCGAVTTLSPERTSDNCPYCGSPLAIQNHYGVKLNVQAVLPFQIDSGKAMAIYRAWVKSLWFAPNDFSRRATREEKLDGVYMPYWTYDADTRTEYRGERGDAYYVTESYFAMVDGRREQRSRQVPRIRWSPAAGTVDVAFDDVLVPASRSLPVHLCDRLTPWNLRILKPFKREYLSGFVTETYQLDLKDGFDDAKRRMAPMIDNAVRTDIGGDQQRIDNQATRYSKVTFKHILLPVWLSAYRYGGETFRFVVNAQTGEVSGERPWSWIKIGLAVAAGVLAAAGIFYWLQQAGVFDA